MHSKCIVCTKTTPNIDKAVIYAKLWNHHGCKQFSICNHATKRTHRQPTDRIHSQMCKTEIEECEREKGQRSEKRMENIHNNFHSSGRCKHVTLKIQRNMPCIRVCVNECFSYISLPRSFQIHMIHEHAASSSATPTIKNKTKKIKNIKRINVSFEQQIFCSFRVAWVWIAVLCGKKRNKKRTDEQRENISCLKKS